MISNKTNILHSRQLMQTTLYISRTLLFIKLLMSIKGAGVEDVDFCSFQIVLHDI